MEGFFSIYILPNCRVILKLVNGDKIVCTAVRSAVFSIVYSQYLFVIVKILPTAVCRPLLSSAAEVEPVKRGQVTLILATGETYRFVSVMMILQQRRKLTGFGSATVSRG
jgi:hypothetical protein